MYELRIFLNSRRFGRDPGFASGLKSYLLNLYII